MVLSISGDGGGFAGPQVDIGSNQVNAVALQPVHARVNGLEVM
jgi:hypothetical protein